MKSERACHLHKLGAEQNVAAIFTIGDHSTKQGEEKNRYLAAESIESQIDSGIGEAVDEPRLRHQLHPGADAGSAGSHPHETEVTVLKCPKDALEQALGLSFVKHPAVAG